MNALHSNTSATTYSMPYKSSLTSEQAICHTIIDTTAGRKWVESEYLTRGVARILSGVYTQTDLGLREREERERGRESRFKETEA